MPTGCVKVSWRTRQREGVQWLTLSWREEGGPLVRPPSRSGFGSRLIKTSVEHELQGAVSITYAEDGFACAIEAPLPQTIGWMDQVDA